MFRQPSKSAWRSSAFTFTAAARFSTSLSGGGFAGGSKTLVALDSFSHSTLTKQQVRRLGHAHCFARAVVASHENVLELKEKTPGQAWLTLRRGTKGSTLQKGFLPNLEGGSAEPTTVRSAACKIPAALPGRGPVRLLNGCVVYFGVLPPSIPLA